jgi:hypothetical protein
MFSENAVHLWERLINGCALRVEDWTAREDTRRIMFNLETLEAWNEALGFANTIDSHAKGFPDDQRFSSTNQMRRAAVAISSIL